VEVEKIAYYSFPQQEHRQLGQLPLYVTIIYFLFGAPYVEQL
jgi:hypothetical protein